MPTFTGLAMPQARNFRSQAKMRSGENENWLTIWTRKPVRGGGGDLLVERGFKPPGRNAVMAFRIGADADLLMPASRRRPFWITASASGNGPDRVDVTADHQQAAHIGFAAQAGEQICQVRRRRGLAARRYGSPAPSPISAATRRRGNQLLRRDRRHRREINRRFRPATAPPARRSRRRSAGWPRSKTAARNCSACRVYSRRREITKDSS